MLLHMPLNKTAKKFLGSGIRRTRVRIKLRNTLGTKMALDLSAIGNLGQVSDRGLSAFLAVLPSPPPSSPFARLEGHDDEDRRQQNNGDPIFDPARRGGLRSQENESRGEHGSDVGDRDEPSLPRRGSPAPAIRFRLEPEASHAAILPPHDLAQARARAL